MNEILTERYGWDVISNREAGVGRFDLCLTSDSPDQKTMIVLECKKSDDKDDLDKDTTDGVKQIHEKRYLDKERARKYPIRIGYGISFHKKYCKVVKR